MVQEIELKFEISARDAQRLAHDPLLAWAPVKHEDQTSVYFDTPKGKLRKTGLTLRLRRSGRKITQTVKSSGSGAGLFDRNECECSVRSMRPDFRAARKTPLAPLLKARTQGKIGPVAKMRIQRTTWLVDDGRSLIEVTSDTGRIDGGDREGRISELELELKRGSEIDLFSFAEKLSRHYPLRIGVLSKADRAFALATGKLVRPRKAPRIDLAPGSTVAEGLTVIAMSCLKHFRLNEELMVEARDPEALHQMRVAIRRLRSAFDLFEPFIEDDDNYERLKKELRSFGLQLGEARNLDVFISGIGNAAADLPRLRHARDELYSHVICLLDGRRFLGLMFRLLRWLRLGDWRDGQRAKQPLDAFLYRRVDANWERVAESGADLGELGEAGRHHLRIQVKKLRYALEFGKSLSTEKSPERKRFAASLEELQEHLGQLNDMRIGRRLARKYCDRSIEEAVANERKRAKAIADAERSFARLLAIGPYWWAEARPRAATAARPQAGSKRPAASRRRAPRSAGSVHGSRRRPGSSPRAS